MLIRKLTTARCGICTPLGLPVDPEVNITAIQPFVNYNLKDGWYLSSEQVITADWSESDSHNQWTIPIGGGIGRVFKIDKQLVNASVGVFHNLQAP